MGGSGDVHKSVVSSIHKWILLFFHCDKYFLICGNNIFFTLIISLYILLLFLDGLTAGCYGGDSEGWFDPWALLQAFKLQVSKIVISFAAQVSFTHCKEIWNYVFPEKELRGLSPNFHIHVSVSDLYFPAVGPPVFLQQNRPTDQGKI